MLNVDVLMLEMLNAHIGMLMWSILDVESFNNFITILFRGFFPSSSKSYTFPSSLPHSIISLNSLFFFSGGWGQMSLHASRLTSEKTNL